MMCPEIGLTTDQLFAWKSRVLTLMETLGQQLQQERKEEEENKGIESMMQLELMYTTTCTHYTITHYTHYIHSQYM